MQYHLFPILIILIGCCLSSCSTATRYKEDTFNPQTQQVEHHSYTPYYQLKTEIIPQQLELTLITHLIKETIPGAYSLKKITRRLLPNDYMAQSKVTIYLKNSGNETVYLDLISISVEQKHLPYSAKQLTIPANDSVTLALGQIDVDLRLTTLNTRIEYIANEHMEKEFDMKRINKKTLTEKKPNQGSTTQSMEVKENDPLEKQMRGYKTVENL